jgi:hypothetical protein
MVTYTARNGTNAVTQDWDGTIIGPEDEAQWADYLQWVADGGVVSPAPYQYEGPYSVALWQMRSALSDAGEFDKVNSDIQSSTNQKLKDFWEYGNTIERYSDVSTQLQVVLGYTNNQMDQLFIDGANEQP